MAQERPTEAKGVESRVLAYGDRAVAQGQTTTASPTVKPKAVAPPIIVDLILVDPRNAVPSSLPATLASEIGAVRLKGWKSSLSGELGASFQARRRGMTSEQERANTGKLEYTLYLLEAHSNATTSWSELHDWLEEHGLIDAGHAHGYFEKAKEAWGNESTIGFGMPPLQGYAKAGAIKVDTLRRFAKSLPFDRALLNVVKHEFAHMCHAVHADAGVMLERAPLSGTPEYDDKAKERIRVDLNRLIKGDAAQLKAAYEHANR